MFRGFANGFDSAPSLQFGKQPPGFKEGEHSVGRGLAAGDVTGDGIDDLVVGTGDVVDEWAGLAAVGGFYFVPGSGSGLRLGDRRFIGRRSPGVHQRGAVVTNELGSALAVADFDRDGFAEVAVGDPAGSDDASSCDPDAPCGGAVLILRGSRTGPVTRGPQRWALTTVKPADPVAGDQIEDNPGNRFGERLAAGDLDRDGRLDLAVAAPLHQVVYQAVGTGRVYVLYGSRAGLSGAGQPISQRTPGVRGIGRVGEGFGRGGLQILDCGYGRTADLLVHSGGDRSSRGTVTVLYGSRRGVTVRGAQLWHQDMPGIPGHGARDDRLGDG